MSELRYDPTRRQWIATATERMDRPQMPRDWCPFCPGSGKVPEHYDVHIYANDFPTLSSPPPEPMLPDDPLYRVKPSWGACDVVLYHPDHNTSFLELSDEHLLKLLRLWQQRYLEHCDNRHVRYVYIFENNGEAIGVTMPHPHGQIYAYPFLPPVIDAEVRAARDYLRKHDRCLHCEIIQRELRFKQRMVYRGEGFVGFIPFWARWPFEVHLYPRKHTPDITALKGRRALGLMRSIRAVLRAYQGYYGPRFPYMMVMHQAPARSHDDPACHLHVEFYPVMRSRTKQKFRAGSETGAGMFVNDSAPEYKAAELRAYVE
ncbi:MAG: galactose-1-phosphate uridylyltransferase [Candidatus Alcyoniella australis]|nr:galactose-1-phosphate uridylyltransferase [Candidatus Alcyoniella australis]